MTELARWMVLHLRDQALLVQLYNEHVVYASFYPSAAVGLWRIH